MKGRLLSAAIALATVSLSDMAVAQDCDALPRNTAFCSAGGQWVPSPDTSTPTSITYVQGDLFLSIAYFNLPDDFAQRQDELRQTLNGMLRNAHRDQYGEDIRIHIEDELYIEDYLANRIVFTSQFGGHPRTIAESIVLRDGWFVAVTTSQAGEEFTERHIAQHDDALGRIALY